MAEFPLNFGTQSHGGRFPPLTGPRHINSVIEHTQEGEPEFQHVMPHGLSAFATISGGGACRGMIVAGTYIYAVSGQKVVKIDSLGGVTELTGAIPGSDNVFMARNGASPFQIAIVVEGKRYYIENDTLASITDTDLPPPNSVTFADQRVIYSINDGRIFWSDVDDVSSIGALSFSTAEGAPDGLVRAFAHRLDVWLFGSETTEIWRSTADSDEPFRRVSGGYIQQGCASHHSVANLGDDLFWVNDKHQVIMARGYAAQVISHLDVARDIAGIADFNEVVGFTYYQGGVGYYVLTKHATDSCPACWTWVYNINIGKWYERSSEGQGDWRARYSVNFNNQWYVGDSSVNKIFKIDKNSHTEDGTPIIWELRNAPVHAYPHRVSVDSLYLNFVTGVGLNSTTSLDADPQVYMSYSDDGGRNWSTVLSRSLGEQGEFLQEVSFHNLGTTGRQGRIFRIWAPAAVSRGLRHATIYGEPVGT